ncbi:MAG: DUF2238 domain-containing protein [Actinomycetota bacterium]|nr:DUF2238 domain-containing protein [Actinomycetota bacterium]
MRRFLLGDWGRVIRDPIDLLRLTFLVGAVVFAFSGDVKGVANLAVAAVAVVVARLVNLPRAYDLAFVLALVFTGWGEALGLYDRYGWYDRVVHFWVPALSAPVAYLALARVEVLPDPRAPSHGVRRYAAIAVVTFALGLAVGALWEIVEWSSDLLLGSNLSEDNEDTVGDLIADALGSLLGAALLVVWTRFGWGSVRRIPGENRFEATTG